MSSTSDKRRIEAEELGWLALAYLDAAVFLCESMISRDFDDSHHRNRVPLYLCHLGLELLFKGALVDAGRTYPKTHNLSKLQEACIGIPDCQFDLPASFGPEDNDHPDLFGYSPPSLFAALHERLRYYSGRDGAPFKAIDRAEPQTLLNEVNTLYRTAFHCAIRLVGRRAASAD